MLPRDLFTVHSVRCGDGHVLLDFETDGYFCRYEGAANEAFVPAARPPEPYWREPPVEYSQVKPITIGRFLLAYATALARFPRRPVRALLIDALQLERIPRPNAPSSVQLAACFERLSLYLPIQPSCLLRAYALLHYLADHGHGADWVIGVQLFPFRAHCWLAIDDVLLGERAHLLEDYVPIYRLRCR